VQRLLAIRDPVADVFHRPRHRLSATAYRAARAHSFVAGGSRPVVRARSFAAWAEVVGAGPAA